MASCENIEFVGIFKHKGNSQPLIGFSPGFSVGSRSKLRIHSSGSKWGASKRISGEVWRHYCHTWVDAASIQWLETRSVAKHSAINKLVSNNKAFFNPSVSRDAIRNADPEKASLVVEWKPLQNSIKPHLNTSLSFPLGNKSLNFLGRAVNQVDPRHRLRPIAAERKEHKNTL